MEGGSIVVVANIAKADIEENLMDGMGVRR